MEMQYYDLKIHMNIVHGDAYVPTDDDGDDDEDEDDTEDELFNSGDESEVENRKRRKRKSRENSKVVNTQNPLPSTIYRALSVRVQEY